jgi:hypothetical protein
VASGKQQRDVACRLRIRKRSNLKQLPEGMEDLEEMILVQAAKRTWQCSLA